MWQFIGRTPSRSTLSQRNHGTSAIAPRVSTPTADARGAAETPPGVKAAVVGAGVGLGDVVGLDVGSGVGLSSASWLQLSVVQVVHVHVPSVTVMPAAAVWVSTEVS